MALSKFDRDVVVKAMDILEREHHDAAVEEIRKVLLDTMYDEVEHG